MNAGSDVTLAQCSVGDVAAEDDDGSVAGNDDDCEDGVPDDDDDDDAERHSLSLPSSLRVAASDGGAFAGAPSREAALLQVGALDECVVGEDDASADAAASDVAAADAVESEDEVVSIVVVLLWRIAHVKAAATGTRDGATALRHHEEVVADE